MSFSVRKNLTALSFIKVAKWMNLVMPVIVLFYYSNGMTLKDIFLLQGIYSVTLMVLEIPTGYFADVAGRRTSILTGSFFGFTGYLIYVSSGSFWMFALAEVILGMGQSLVSGADSALLYDTLAARRLSGSYNRLEGKITSIGNFAEAFAGLLGGLLALVSLRTPFMFQAGIAFIAVPAAFLLQEPPVRLATRKLGIRDIVLIIRTTLVTDKKLRWNTLFSAFTGASTLTMAWFAQPFFKQVGVPLGWYGAIWAILNLSVGLAAWQAWRVETKTGSRKVVLLFSVALVSVYLLLAFFPVAAAMPFLLIFYLARGLATPLLRNYINKITESDVRATVLSVRNFVIRMVFSVLGPLFGWVNDHFDLPTALLLAGVLFGLLNGLSLIYFFRYKGYSVEV